MSNPLLLIGGPTAIGKTELALRLANELDGELISADSRQVYRGMDIGTGKDIPKNAKFKQSNIIWSDSPLGYYQSSDTKIWGYDLVEPHQDFSAAHYFTFAHTLTPTLWRQGTLPIFVGGTGLYLQTLIDPPDTLNVQPDEKLRDELSWQTVNQLQQKLLNLNQERFEQMNRSDKYNPRRLIRAIEVAQQPAENSKPLGYDKHLFVVLDAPGKVISRRITKRVKIRSRAIKTEVEKLHHAYPDFKAPAFTATGYKIWQQYLNGNIPKKEALEQWSREELQYAKRQQTWFAKRTAERFDITHPQHPENVVEQVKNWYATLNGS